MIVYNRTPAPIFIVTQWKEDTLGGPADYQTDYCVGPDQGIDLTILGLEPEIDQKYKLVNSVAFQAQEMAREVAERLKKAEEREKILVEALEKISCFYIGSTPGHFGEFIGAGAGAVHLAKEALKRVREMKDV